MKILVIGGGGREHALCWKIAKSKKVSKIYCAPGNGGTQEIAENIEIGYDEIDRLLDFALKKAIDLTVVGPEAPLVEGIVDKFNEKGLKIFGVNQNAAQLEGSKIYAKEFMERYNIPTAKYRRYTDIHKAIEGLDEFNYPLVIKADGLCAGKGVIICNTREEGIKTLKSIMEDRIFGNAGESLIIEEFLEGIEASLLCFVSRGKLIPMESARDYKKIFDEDSGPNTGGVGCFSPSNVFNKGLKEAIQKEILFKIEKGFKNEYSDYNGVLFIGLMLTKDMPKVLEFNVRFGDPETEVLMPRLKNDIIDILQKTLDGSLEEKDLEWTAKKCVTVVLTSKGYPGEYEKNKEIIGLRDLDKDVFVFHNGTSIKNGKIYTNGGRVISVTSLGGTLEEARSKVYENVKKIYFEGVYYRKDIARIWKNV